jgi:hypothetical protein
LTANSALLIEFEIIELEMAPEVEIVEDETPGEVPSVWKIMSESVPST